MGPLSSDWHEIEHRGQILEIHQQILATVLKIVGQNAVLSGQDSVLPYKRCGFSPVVVL